MLKLIRASLYRYVHNRLLYVLFAFLFVSSVLFALYIRESNGLNFYIFIFCNVGLAVLISLTVSGEICGCAKNKIICGKSRIKVYFSELISAYAVVSVCFLFGAAVSAVINTGFVGRTPVSLALKVIMGFYLITLSSCSVFVFFSAVGGRKVVSVILCVIFVFSSALAKGLFEDWLRQPEYNVYYTGDRQNTETDENGNVYELDPEKDDVTEIKQKNPEYLISPFREIVIHLIRTDPFYNIDRYNGILTPYMYPDEKINEMSEIYPGTELYSALLKQRFVREETEEENRFLMTAPLYSLAVIALSVAAGAIIFRKKKFN